MRFLARAIVAVIANGVGLLAAAYFIPGFVFTNDPKDVLVIALLFTLINLFLKNILKFLFGPIIILTLGVGLLLINALMLYLLDFLRPDLTIQGIPALLGATLIVSVLNFIFHLATKT